MSESYIDVTPSELDKDSEIGVLELCSDGSGNWFIRLSENKFITESGDIVDAEDGSLPESAVYSSIIKTQQVAQSIDASELSTSKEEKEEDTDELEEEAEETDTDEESMIDADKSDTETVDDHLPEEDSKEDLTDNEKIDATDPIETVSSDEGNSRNDSEEESDDTTKIENDKTFSENPFEEEQDEMVDKDDWENSDSRGTLFEDSEEEVETDSEIDDATDNWEDDKETAEEKDESEDMFADLDTEDELADDIDEMEEDGYRGFDDEVEGEEGLLDSLRDQLDIEEESMMDAINNYIGSDEEALENVDEKEDSEESSDNDDEGLMETISGLLDSDNKETEESHGKNEFSDSTLESEEDNQTEQKSGDNHENEKEFNDTLEDEEPGLVDSIKDYIGSEDEEEEETSRETVVTDMENDDFSTSSNKGEFDKEESETVDDTIETDEEFDEDLEDSEDGILDEIEQFVSSDIAEIDQERPDAQNVSIDFLDRDSDDNLWSDTMETFWDKLRRARRGETEAKKDITTDLWSRYKALIFKNSYARGDVLDAFVGIFLITVGVIAVTAGILSMFLGDVASLEVLTEESTYADHITLTTIVLFITGISFWLSRRTKSKTIVSAIRKPARVLQFLIVLLQISVIGLLIYMLTIGGGQEALGGVEQSIADSLIGVLASLPVGSETLISLVEAYRGPESITGFSIVEASLLMATVGFLIAYPVLKRTLARFVLTANMGAREFREETGILIEEISQGGQELDEPDYILGGHNEEVESDGRRRVTREQMYDIEEESEREGLIALPDHIKSSPFADYEEVRRYWVRAPYSYISIVYNERQNDYRYVVVEPELDESERVIFDELKKRLDNVLLFEDVEEYEDHEQEIQAKLKKLEKRMIELSEEYEIDINDKTFHRLMYFIERDYVYYNKIDPLINDPNVEDISCDGEDQYLFVFHSDYKDVMTNVMFEKEELRSFVQELAQRSGEHISAADPMVDASLPDGSRAQMTLGSEVTTHGSTFTIRLFEDIPFTPVDLLDYDTFSMTQMAYLWTAIEHNKSLIFAGGTASGKTTSMNAVSMFIPPKAKVITIEDTREISLPQKNWIPGTTREGVGGEEGGDDIDMYELLRAALRQRPEYIVVGEIRGREAETLFQAMNTGHTTYSTMHAETVDAAIGRLTNPPINVPKQMITALDIICIQNQIRFTDDEGNQINVRRNEETREIVGLRDNGQFKNRRPFQWDAETDNFIESLEDSHVLERVANENGWTPEDKRTELQQREEVLEYMVEENIREFDYVTNIIQAYMVDPDKIIREVRNDTLEPEDLKSLTEMEWETPEVEEPDTTLNEKLDDGENQEQASAGVQSDTQ